MGGKSNQSQRTKNSARPSSSGRSAEFLQGASKYTFSGFTAAGAGGAETIPIETPINEEIASIDPNIQVVLKKLTKKDSITKGKALLELAQLIEDSDIEVVKAVLPLWPRLFKSLYADISHRVREYCQQAHRAFVVKLSKQIAPILKQICAEWIGSQFDTYAPAASVAKGSLAAAFPNHKLKDVLAFCHEEILDYVHRMLLVPMPMPADKSYTPEEYEARSERLLYMGLCTYNFYLCNTATGLWKDKLERHRLILADGKFWSYAKHKSPQVKAAWLEAIGTILDRTTELLDEYHPKIVSAVVQNLDDGDALIQSAAWTCLLRIQLMVPNWLAHTNMEKAFLVKIRKVLSAPNQGLNMHFLPFLSHMNGTVLGVHCRRFLMDFFESMKSAMTKSGSGAELKGLVDTYFECLHFVTKQLQTEEDFITLPDGSEDKSAFKRLFMESFLVHPIQWTVGENGKALEHIARNVGLILGYWNANKELFGDLWSGFWDSLGMSVFVKTEDQQDVGAFERQIQFAISLRRTDVSSISGSPKKIKKRVHFGGAKEEEDEDLPEESPQQAHRSNDWIELFNVVDELCQRCVHQMIILRNPIFMKLLFKLLSKFNDERLANSIDKALPLADFVAKILQWIADESIVNEEMIDLLMIYGVKAVNLQEIVKKLMQVDNYSVKNWTVMKVAKHSKISLSECTSIAAYMEHILMRLINRMPEATDNRRMIQTYFDQTLKEKPTEEHKVMIEMISAEIESGELVNEQLNSLARYLLQSLNANAETTAIITRLFMTVFNLSLNGVDKEAGPTCIKSVKGRKVCLDDNLMALCVDQVNGKLVELLDGENFDIENVVQSCLLLVNRDMEIAQLKDLLSSFATKDSDGYLDGICLMQMYLEDRVYLLELDCNSSSENHLRSLLKTLLVARLRGLLCVKAIEEGVQFADDGMLTRTLAEIIYIDACARTLVNTGMETVQVEVAVKNIQPVIDDLLAKTNKDSLKQLIIDKSAKIGGLWTYILWELKLNEATEFSQIVQSAGLNHLKQIVNFQPPKSIPKDALESAEIPENLAYICTLFRNYFSGDFNTVQESAIIRRSCELLDKVIPLSKTKQLNLMYNAKPEVMDEKSLRLAADLATLLKMLLDNCPMEITAVHWDFLRIALSSWILTVSNVLPLKDSRPAVNRFILAVMELFNTLMAFFETERKKSSTQLLCKVQEEWNSVFAREVNTVLLLILHQLLIKSRDMEKNKYLLRNVLPCFERINFIYLMLSKDISKTVSQCDFLRSLLHQLSNPVAAIRHAVLCLAHKIIPQLVAVDNERLAKSDEDSDGHFLQTIIAPLFESTEFDITEYVAEFNYKTTDGENVSAIPEVRTMSFLYLWNVVLEFCRQSTPELRAFYAKWIASRGMEAQLLKIIFRLLPQDVIKNFETKSSMVEIYFNSVKAVDICDKILNTEQLLVCFSYLNLVRLLPAVVRKCWTNLPHRTNLLIEKFNMFYASSLLCHEELRALIDKREKMDNIHISVHNSTREIIACYAKEEARMELVITLPLNYPLNVPKVEGGKSVNSRIQSKEVLMQLNIFLSHQNGTIFNGLALWKRNLDKKFEGVEECYVCYSVIHQDTYQLPKLTCKTCKKKFHSPCLYRWFSTSNKSTCPICRNIF